MCSLEYILPAEIYGKVLLWFFCLDSPVLCFSFLLSKNRTTQKPF